MNRKLYRLKSNKTTTQALRRAERVRSSDLLCFVELPQNLSNKYFSPTHDMPKTAQIAKSQKSNVANYSPMQTKVFIQRVAANTYHLQPMGSGPLKPAVVKANSAQEALTIYKQEVKVL